MFNYLKYKIFFWFITLAIIILIVIIPYLHYYFGQKQAIYHIIHKTDVIHKYILQDFKCISDFIRYETSNIDFFASQESHYLTKHKRNSEKITSEINQLLKNKELNKLSIGNDISSLLQKYKDYNDLFATIDSLIRVRGIKDYGTVGEMRKYVHRLEEYNQIDQNKVLSLRRHEKDYIIRHQDIYISKLNNLGKQFGSDILKDPKISRQTKDTIISILNNYLHQFNRLVEYESRIGIEDNTGLKSELSQQEVLIEHHFNEILTKAEYKKIELYDNLKSYYTIFFLLLIGLIILLSLLIAKKTTLPLIQISHTISQYVKNGFKINKQIEIPKTDDEVKIIYKEFLNLIEQLEKREKEKLIAQESLLASELNYQELADMLPQSIYETDTMGNYTYVNKTWYKTFGYSKDDITNGLNILETIISNGKQKQIGKTKYKPNEYLAKRKDGSTFNALVYSNQITKNELNGGYRGIIIDNTVRKKYIQALETQKRKAEESDRLKSAFLANMSHEIRTPMNAIIGFTNILADNQEIKDEQKNEYINIIKSSANDLLNLINDIIDIAKIEAGQIMINKQNTDINEIVNKLFLTFNKTLELKDKTNITLVSYKSSPEEQFYVYTDPVRLKQILVNLVGNAIKFTEAGKIEFGYTIEDNNQVIFYVSDTGIGISEEQKAYIFERFRQAESEKKVSRGTGLGLTISKSLCKLLGGDIWIESEIGKGSTFYFTIPFEIKTNEENRYHNNHPSTIEQDDLVKEYIELLIVEDNDNSFLYLRQLLADYNIKIIRAISGHDAVKLCKQNSNLDLILMDIQLPELNGYEATKMIREFNKNIPIIAQTAYAMKEDKDKCLQAGCNDYLSKPIDKNALVGILNTYLKILRPVES